ncbi:MAG: hypothetical protein GY930_01320 [bacterium]|nr:hypothetical protein [bacterium]
MAFPRSIASPAKVNWTLKVGPKRTTGFHGVETLMLALGLQDSLTLRLDPRSPKGSMRLAIQGPAHSSDIPTDGHNLILRAASSVARWQVLAMRELPCGLRFELEKHVPSQAGLGGGSSNAAAAAMALLLALEVRWTEEDLLDLLAELGSDCPFFGHVLGRSKHAGDTVQSALGYDQGQRIRAQIEPVPPLQISVVTPPVGCPTGAIYAAVQDLRSDLEEQPDPMAWSSARSSRCNDLEASALAAVFELRPWRQALTEYAGQAFQLSGSGASFYGVIPAGEDPEPWHRDLLAHLGGGGLIPRFHWNGPLFSL